MDITKMLAELRDEREGIEQAIMVLSTGPAISCLTLSKK